VTSRWFTSFAVALALAAAAWLVSPAAQDSPDAIPRTPDGRPDISGVWQSGGVSLYGDQGRAGPPGGPRGAPPPRREPPAYQPWAAEKQQQLTAIDDPTAHCLLPGVPRITSMPMPFEIVQTRTKVIILYEAFHAFRIIPVDDQLRHPDDLTPTWMGDSVGRWEGDTFVVDVVGFNDKTWLGGLGTHHTEALHVIERYTLEPDRTIAYEARAEDPGALAKPWVYSVTLRQPRNARVEEYECIENNQDIAHMRPRVRF
jgi:hypothetical protein